MKRKSEREYPILWEAVKVAFDKKINLDKWFTPTESYDMHGDQISFSEYKNAHPQKKQKLSKISNMPNTPKFKTRTVGLRPTKKQKEKLDLLMKGSNYAYNFALRMMTDYTSEFVEDESQTNNDNEKLASMKKLQSVISCQNPKAEKNKHKLKYFEGVPDWYMDIPSLVKQHALKKFLTAYNTAKKRKGTLKEKDLSCRDGGSFGVTKERKEENRTPGQHLKVYPRFFRDEESIGVTKGQNEENRIPGQNLKVYQQILDEESIDEESIDEPKAEKDQKYDKSNCIRMKSRFDQPINHDYTVYKNAVGKYYALIPIPFTQKDMKQDAVDKMVGIDPGVRTFATVYDPSRCKATQYGNKDDCQYQPSNKSRKKEKAKKKKSIEGILNKLDGVTRKRKSVLDSVNCKSREDLEEKVKRGICGKRKMKKYEFYSKLIAIANYRLKNKVKDLHRTLARKLVDENELIVIGKLNVSDFNKSKHGNGKGQHTMRRRMRMWSHYKFREYLKFKALEVKGCKVVIQDERRTSQTCGHCGNRKKDLGGNKTYHCDKCSYETDRDVNGARNILRKFLGEFS